MPKSRIVRATWSSRVLTVIAALAVVTGVLEAAADACSFAAPQVHTLDPAEQAQDTQPPTTPQISHVQLVRGRGASVGCGGSMASSCDDLGRIGFQVASSDDRTPPSALGYKITLVRGKAPPFLNDLGQTIRSFGGGLVFIWFDGATDAQEDLDFDLEIRAVDLGGNVSAAAAILPVRDGNTACRIGSRGGSWYSLLIGVLGLFTALRRKSAVPRPVPGGHFRTMSKSILR